MGTNLKKALFFLYSMAFLLNIAVGTAFAAPQGAVKAQVAGGTRLEAAQEEAIKNLGLETTGILPSNPFYFFKEWGRGIRKALSFGPTKRAELELAIANEQAAEIIKLRELDITSAEAYSHAVASYAESITRLRARLAAQDGDMIPPRFSALLLDRALKHADIFDGLYAWLIETPAPFASAERIAESVAALQRDIATTVRLLADTSRDAAAFTNQLRGVSGLQRGKWRELKTVELIARVEVGADTALRDALAKLRLHLLLQLAGRLEGATLQEFEHEKTKAGNTLEELPGIPLARLRALDALRDAAEETDVKNYVNLIRSKLFDRLRSVRGISKSDAEAIVAEMNASLADVAGAIGEPPRRLRLDIASALERAKFAAASAEGFLEDGVYDSAYGQASAGLAAAEHIYAELLLGEGDIASELKMLKQEFDALQSRAALLGREKGAAPKLAAALGNAERAIAKVADLIAANAADDRIAEGVRAAKRAMGAAAELADESEGKK